MTSDLPSWFGTGHERRAKAFACLALLSLAVASVGVLAAPSHPRVTVSTDAPESNTLVALQGYHHEGRAVEVTPDGEIAWEYAKPDDVFDAEALAPDRIQLSTANEIPDRKCPARFRNDGFENCVRNSLRIVDKSSKETVWEYAWYDVKLHEHELHDADHYTVNGEDRWVMVDMGNDRVFAVNRQKEVVWEWNATDAYERPAKLGPEGDWTHVNDVDRIRPGVFQISLRNFDTVAELRVRNGFVSVRPVVGPNSYAERGDVLHEQHNPDRLADGHLLVADSENDRVVELNRSGDIVWEFGGSATLDWPRDADRLPNGHTLVADSYNDRVVEVNERGEVVWAVETGGLPYEADRLPAEWSADARAEGSSDRPTAPEANLSDGVEEGSVVEGYAEYAVSMAKYVLPVGFGEQLFPLTFGLLSLFGAAIEGVLWRR
ncbi:MULTISPECIES: hypothetical protein [Halorussus]|uniref:hypothetical protein n=1 Tax=Halorussus TaxID=1070314 RepID=UPI0020A0DDF4|nr:hypothetical protein [Halorussus vallis]USZ74817.1 hypothetical protein NGM07_15410 [Halorussus vallis]